VYEVSGVREDRADKCNIAMKALPCPCLYCYSNDMAHYPCSNLEIVGPVKLFELEEIPPSECPVLLYEPINEKYSNEVLKLFIRSHEMRLKGAQNKPQLCDFIRSNLGDFVEPIALH
jgi:hypothetical protein